MNAYKYNGYECILILKAGTLLLSLSPEKKGTICWNSDVMHLCLMRDETLVMYPWILKCIWGHKGQEWIMELWMYPGNRPLLVRGPICLYHHNYQPWPASKVNHPQEVGRVLSGPLCPTWEYEKVLQSYIAQKESCISFLSIWREMRTLCAYRD